MAHGRPEPTYIHRNATQRKKHTSVRRRPRLATVRSLHHVAPPPFGPRAKAVTARLHVVAANLRPEQSILRTAEFGKYRLGKQYRQQQQQLAVY